MLNKSLLHLIILIALLPASLNSPVGTKPCLSKAAQCTGGICCSKCKFSAVGVQCRAARDECDRPEVCSGFSSQCPGPDIFAEDGHPCGRGQGICIEGKCVSKTSRMNLVEGRSEVYLKNALGAIKSDVSRGITFGSVPEENLIHNQDAGNEARTNKMEENKGNLEVKDVLVPTKPATRTTNLKKRIYKTSAKMDDERLSEQNFRRTLTPELLSSKGKKEVAATMQTVERIPKGGNHKTEQHGHKKEPSPGRERSSSRDDEHKANAVEKWFAGNRHKPLFIALCSALTCFMLMSIAFAVACCMYRRERTRRVKIATRVHKNLRSDKSARSRSKYQPQVSKIEGANVDVGGY